MSWISSAVWQLFTPGKALPGQVCGVVGIDQLILRMTQLLMFFINEEFKKFWKTSFRYHLSPQPRLEEAEVRVTVLEKSSPPCPPRAAAPGTLDLPSRTPWAKVDLKPLRWKRSHNQQNYKHFHTLNKFRFTQVSHSYSKKILERLIWKNRRKAKHYTKSLWYPRTSITTTT